MTPDLHPRYEPVAGTSRTLDTEGRVERFRRRFGSGAPRDDR